MESNDIRELFPKKIVEKANKEMIDYAVSDELALKMMLRATQDAAFQNFLGNYIISTIGKIIEKLEAENE